MSLHAHNFRSGRRRTAPPGQKGFSLLEFIIYIGLIGLVLAAATGFAMEFALTQAKTTALEEASRNARFAVSRIATEIREATDYNVGSSTFGVNPSTLSLATATGSTNPTVFSVSGGKLYVTQGVGAAQALTSSKVAVTEFQVDDLSTAGKTKVFRIHLRLNYVNPSAAQTFAADYSFETTAQIMKNDGFSN